MVTMTDIRRAGAPGTGTGRDDRIGPHKQRRQDLPGNGGIRNRPTVKITSNNLDTW
jgi:hypothetical protein